MPTQCFLFSVKLGIDAWVAITLGVLAAGGAGWLLDKAIYLPLRQKKASVMVLLVASLGAFTAIQALIAIAFTANFQTLSQRIVGTQPTFDIGGGVVTMTQVWIVISAILFVAGTPPDTQIHNVRQVRARGF